MTTKYRMYIDESGNSDIGRLDDPSQRFLSLTGVIIDLTHVRRVVSPEMDALKYRYFGKSVIFHRSEIVNHLGPFGVLKQEDIRSQFDDELLQRLSGWDYTIMTVCIDKKQYAGEGAQQPYDPYQRCLAALMERFHHWLKARSAVGDLMIEARGTREDQRLKQMFRACMDSDTAAIAVRARDLRRTFTSRELKIQPKQARESGLEIADLLANPSRNEILRDQGLLHTPAGPFTSRIMSTALKPKYHTHNGVALGYGKTLLTDQASN